MKPDVTLFFDEATNTAYFMVAYPKTRHCAIIDSVLDFDYASGGGDFHSADQIIDFVQPYELRVAWILETHVHADHLSAAPYLQEKLGGQIGFGEKITVVQHTFGKVFNEGTEFQRDGSQFDQFFLDGDVFNIGSITASVLHTLGHAPACLTYVIGNAAFVGDTLFMPDFGTARVDFPGGSAEALYASAQKPFTLPDETRVFVWHDYKAAERDAFAWETTIGAQKSLNKHVGQGRAEEDFIALRMQRDAELSMPRLIIPSLQVNMRAGGMPPAEDDGNVYLKVPVNRI